MVCRGFLEGLGLWLCAQGQVGLVGGEGSHAILSGQAGTSLLIPYRFWGPPRWGQGQKWRQSAPLVLKWWKFVYSAGHSMSLSRVQEEGFVVGRVLQHRLHFRCDGHLESNDISTPLTAAFDFTP